MIVVFVGPSGSGKSTVIASLRQRYATMLPIESFTTRPIRANDVKGEQIFVTNEEFLVMAERDEFLWVHKPYGLPYRYGMRTAKILECVRDPTRLFTAVLLGAAAQTLWDLVKANHLEEGVRFFFFVIQDLAVLERRMAADPTRTNMQERLSTVHQEHSDAYASSVPFVFIRASEPLHEVVGEVERVMGLCP